MTLGGFGLLDGDSERDALVAELRAFHDLRPSLPPTSVHAAFSARARLTPEACAAVDDARAISYAALDRESNRMAHQLRACGIGHEAFVGVMLDDCVGMVTALLGVLKAGGAYLPLDPRAPYDRQRHALRDTGARVLIASRAHMRRLNRLHWDCPALRYLLCPDSDDALSEPEEHGQKMRREVWDHVGLTATDDISGGGWQSSYTGEWLSRGVMDDYGDNIRTKLAPLLTPGSRVLEIGCASGISMFRLAPLVAEYVGTDLSPEILSRTATEASRRGAGNVRLEPLAAHEIDRVTGGPFDAVIINSVLQCFSGHNYLRDVLRKAVTQMSDRGILFLGNVFDQDLKDVFLEELRAFRRKHAGTTYRTKTDYSEELFINRAFLEDLRHDLAGVTSVECSPLIGTHESELSRFSFDALLRIDKTTAPAQPLAPKNRVLLDARDVASQPDTPLADSAGPASLAYAMYTSGTSGTPKAVLVEHRAIARLVIAPSYVTLGEETRILMTGAPDFDATTFEVWGALLNGGTICRPPAMTVMDASEVSRRIAAWRINTMWMTAGLFNHLVDTDLRVFRGLSTLLIGGERLSPRHVTIVRDAYPDLVLVNGYGPTENTTFTTCYAIPRGHAGDVPIGRPISGTEVLILDAAGELVPVGVPGEIHAAGDGLARGYLNDPALTDERFRWTAFEPVRRIYRTGDRGRWRGDGTIEFLGRDDDQVKIRGFRIEPAEIAHAILDCPGVRDAIVIATEATDEQPQRELVAYVVGDAAPAALRQELKDTLPDYLVPAHIVPIAALPLTPHGKVDYRALPKPAAARDSAAATRPLTSAEQDVISAWGATLMRGDVVLADNFFDIGGDSIRAMKVVDRLRRSGWQVHLGDFFTSKTAADLAGGLQRAVAESARTSLTGFVPLGPVQRWFFATHRGPVEHFGQCLALSAAARVDEAALGAALQALVDGHDMLRAVYPRDDTGRAQFVRPRHHFDGFEVIDIAPDPDQAAAWASIAEATQGPFDLEHGPLFRAVLVRSAGIDRLLLAAHHLVVDGVSWRIILDDLDRLYRVARDGGVMDTPAEPASFAEHVERSDQGATGPRRDAEDIWWRAIDDDIPPASGVASPPNTYGDTQSAGLTMTVGETARVLGSARDTDGAGPRAVLLTALARALRRWTGNDRHVVTLESHGRAAGTPPLALERTVGWFTALFPFELEAEGDEVEWQLRRTSAALRAVPGGGAGFAAYASRRYGAGPWPAPVLSFNYLGHVDAGDEEGVFTLEGQPPGLAIAPALTKPHALDLNGMSAGGRLEWTLSYHAGLYSRERAEALLSFYRDELLVIAEHRQQLSLSGATASSAHSPAAAGETLLALEAAVRGHSDRERDRQIAQLLRDEWGVDLPADTLAALSNPAAIADAAIDGARFGNALGDDMCAPLGGTEGPPVFLFPPATGDPLGYVGLARIVHGVRWFGFNYEAGSDRAAVYADHVARLAGGPPILAGHSGGGHLAYATAVELERRGIAVRAVLAIDAGRLVAPIPFDETGVEMVAAAFLRDADIRAHAKTPPLRDKLRRRIRAYYERVAIERHDAAVAAPIHVLLAERPPASQVPGAGGYVSESVEGWRELTAGGLRIWQGHGDHARMLLPPALAPNARVIDQILREIAGA